MPGPLRWLRRCAELSREDLRLLVRAFITLGLIDLGLRVWGFRRVVEGAERPSKSAARAVGADELHRARQYARLVELAARHHVVRARCLHRSLALHLWLRGQRLPSELRIGVRKEHFALQAHAWVELGGQFIDESPEWVGTFTPLRSGDGEQPTWTSTAPWPVVPSSTVWNESAR
jgi:hypothetical protein